MAVTETRQLVNPTLEGSLTAFLKKLDPLGGQAINTAAYAPQVAARNTLQTGAETAAAGLGALTGDIVESFIKRQSGMERGHPLFLLDHLDYIFG